MPYTPPQERHLPLKTAFDFFTGGETKTPDFTIFYNIAFDSIGRIKEQIKTWPVSRQNAFMAEYLWKAHLLQKNANGYELTVADERIIEKLFEKVEAIRNYHSHIWHDNSVLAFDPELKSFVDQKYAEAKAALFAEFPNDLLNYEQLENLPKMKPFALFKFVQDKEAHYITQEGRLFFLSFFLTTGQMHLLLQQRRGFKRSDMPLFKIKRRLYTYYCHRDGSSVTDFNHEERWIDSMSDRDQQDIFRARAAYKLVSHLYDYPSFWADRDAMPLVDGRGGLIKNVEQLKDYLDNNPMLLPGLTFQLLQQVSSDKQRMDQEIATEKWLKQEEDKYRLGVISFSCDEIPGYAFHIDFDTLYRLVVLQTLQNSPENDDSPCQTLKQNLKQVVENRSRLYQILLTPEMQRTPDDRAYLADRKNQYLRGSRKLTEHSITFFEALGKGNDPTKQECIRLANYIRSSGVAWIDLPSEKGNKTPTKAAPAEPIQVYQQDFISGTQQKFRPSNRFMLYATRFLMDFAGDQWYWGMEKFEMARKDQKARSESLLRKKTYLRASEISPSDDYRLTIENDHIYLALPKTGEGESNHERFYQFALGPQAMRYLGAYILAHKEDYAQRLERFLQMLASDVQTLHQLGGWKEDHNFLLLEPPFVPGYLKKSTNDLEAVKQSVAARINHIRGEWERALANKPYLTRSQKNSLIMDAYRLFDWPKGSDGNPRFFRTAEYSQMSICHYSLHLKERKEQRNWSTGRVHKKKKMDWLFDDVFKLNSRRPAIPAEIINLVRTADSLDDLMVRVFENRTEYLNERFRLLADLPGQQTKKLLPAFCRQLGISMPAELLRGPERETLRGKQAITLSVQPYAIHPMLVVKYFFPEHYQSGSGLQQSENRKGQLIKKRPVLPIFSDLRKNQQLRNKLVADFYDEQVPAKLYPNPEHQKFKEKLTGVMNTTCIEDMILWWMANEYLYHNPFTKSMGELLKKQRDPSRRYVGDLHALAISLPLTQVAGHHSLYVSILMHQLDDLIFMVQKSRLRKAAIHFLRRCGVEKDMWASSLQDLLQRHSESEILPDGSLNNPFPFQLLLDELDWVRRTGQGFGKYILEFEKSVLEKAIQEHGTKERLHEWLLSDVKTRISQTNHPVYFYNFESILELAKSVGKAIDADIFETVSRYRNIAFHNDIPDTGSFSWLTKEGMPLRKLLKIDSDLHAKKDKSKYESGSQFSKLENPSDSSDNREDDSNPGH